ncbi:MAG: oligosaccharide flippase family protein, partial [Anaerolineales bacterium]|nr:oligosaccharide flippase family protein [Anaerolineales bacterium]
VRTLGADDYGLWALIGSLAAYGGLLDLGIASAVSKYIAEYRARGDVTQAQRLVATALGLYTALGGLALLLSVVAAPWVPVWFGLSAGLAARAQTMALLTGVGVALGLPSAITYAILRGLQRFELVNILSIVGVTLTAVSMLVVIQLGGGVVGLTAVAIPLELGMQVAAVWLIRRAAPELRLSWRDLDWKLLRPVASFSSALLVLNVATQVKTKTDEIVIGAFLPIAAVTPYSLARRLSEIPQLLSDQMVKVLMPLASQLSAADDQGRLRQLYLLSSRLTLGIAIPLAVGLIVLAEAFLTVWVGARYAEAAGLLIVLTCAGVFTISQMPAGSILQGTARHRRLALLALGSALLNLVLSVVLVRPFGVMGVALGTLIPNALEAFGLIMPYAMRLHGVTARTAVAEIFWPALAPAVPMAVVVVGLREWLQPANYFTLLLVGLTGGLVYLGGYAALCWRKPERDLGRQFWGEGQERWAAWWRTRRR